MQMFTGLVRTRTDLKPIGPILLSAVQEHTACFTENIWAPRILRLVVVLIPMLEIW